MTKKWFLCGAIEYKMFNGLKQSNSNRMSNGHCPSVMCKSFRKNENALISPSCDYWLPLLVYGKSTIQINKE